MASELNTITSLRKIHSGIRVETVPEKLKIGGITKGRITYYPQSTLDAIIEWFENTSKEEKKEQTCLEKYGTANLRQVKEIEERRMATYNSHAHDYSYSSFFTPEVLAKCRESNLRNHNGIWNSKTQEYRNKIKQTCQERYGTDNISQIQEVKDKKRETMISRYGRMFEYKKIEYDGKWFDSSWEVAYYKKLVEGGKDFEYHPNIRLEYIYQGKKHYYEPDFLVEGKLVEIKGNHFFENGKMICPFNRELDGLYNAKFECMVANNVEIITEKV